MNPAFQAAQAIGTNISGGFRKAQDESAIEGILSQAISSGDPQILQDSIGKILSQVSPERQGAAIKYLENAYNKVQERKKISDESAIEQRDYEIVKKELGEKFANVWRSQTPGGRTELLKSALESNQRGRDLDKMFDGSEKPSLDISESEKKAKDFDKGLTPKERARRQESRYSTNLPLYQKSVDKLNAYETSKDDLNILKELSPQIPFIERLNINPVTGDLLIPAAASPEAQRYVKTINEFTRTAKDTYGARVTNFDLTQFLKRLPTLANSEEGRRQIIDQMGIITKINLAYEKSLQDVIDSYGGIRNVDFDEAERIARKKSQLEINDLRNEFNKISSNQDKIYEKQVKNIKDITPKGRVAVEFSDGRQAHIDKNKVEEFLKIPGNKLL